MTAVVLCNCCIKVSLSKDMILWCKMFPFPGHCCLE